jgi:hypothetical protein
LAQSSKNLRRPSRAYPAQRPAEPGSGYFCGRSKRSPNTRAGARQQADRNDRRLIIWSSFHGGAKAVHHLNNASRLIWIKVDFDAGSKSVVWEEDPA